MPPNRHPDRGPNRIPSNPERSPHKPTRLSQLAAMLLVLSGGSRAAAESTPAPLDRPAGPEPTHELMDDALNDTALEDSPTSESTATEPSLIQLFIQFLRGSAQFFKEHPLGIRINFWEPDGTPRFNDWQTWVEPLTLEVGYPVASEMFNVTVPYEFSAHFTVSEPTEERAFQEMKREMITKLREAWLEEIKAWPGSFFADEVTLWESNDFTTPRHPSRQLEVRSRATVSHIAVTGSASPEHAVGNQQFGDYLNEQLATRRGEDAQAALLQAFPYLAVEDLPIGFAVPEYTQEDLNALIDIGHQLGMNPAESSNAKLMKVIQKYNDGEIRQPDLQATVQSIVGDRRSVQLEVTFENGRQGVLQIPFPILILIGLGVLGRYFSHRGNQPPPPPAPVRSPRPPLPHTDAIRRQRRRARRQQPPNPN